MHSITLDSTDAEEIIKLRVDLARSKNKLAKYQEFVAKMDQFDQQINSLLQRFNSRQNLIHDLCSQVGIQMQPQKLIWKEPQCKNRWENSEHLLNMIYKHEELGKCLEKEDILLKNISKAIVELAKKEKADADRYNDLEKEHKQCSSKINGVIKQLQKMENLEKELKLKELQIIELEKSREDHNLHAGDLASRIESQSIRIRQLEGEVEEKQMQISRGQQRQAEEEMLSFQKQRALEKCHNLIDMLSIGQEDYLNHYFKSNGLSLEAQKPYKNKYSMVFD